MLYEMCALRPPFDATSLAALSLKILKGTYNPMPAMYSQNLKTLVQQLLNVNATRRPTVNQILQMPLI